jgi:threonine synthase
MSSPSAGRTRTPAAAGIRVPAAVGDFLILRAVRESGGTAVAVSEEAIMDSWQRISREEGVLMCPEGAATHAAYLRLLDQTAGWRPIAGSCCSTAPPA